MSIPKYCGESCRVFVATVPCDGSVVAFSTTKLPTQIVFDDVVYAINRNEGSNLPNYDYLLNSSGQLIGFFLSFSESETNTMERFRRLGTLLPDFHASDPVIAVRLSGDNDAEVEVTQNCRVWEYRSECLDSILVFADYQSDWPRLGFELRSGRTPAEGVLFLEKPVLTNLAPEKSTHDDEGGSSSH